MNPSTTGGPELQLPIPITPNQAPDVATAPAGVQALPQPASPATGAQLPPLPAAFLPPTPSQADVSGTTNIAVPAAAEDQDLIEKEWVSKAKQIVNKTHNDPYQQSQELNLFKSDYMQKRYNKSIKMSE